MLNGVEWGEYNILIKGESKSGAPFQKVSQKVTHLYKNQGF